MERVLLESGVGGVVALHNYYHEYILKYERNVKVKAETLLEEQRQKELSACNIKWVFFLFQFKQSFFKRFFLINKYVGKIFYRMELDEITSKFPFEELDAFGNVYREVPTLQLSDPDVGFPPSLDAGFQMLHNLEQDE